MPTSEQSLGGPSLNPEEETTLGRAIVNTLYYAVFTEDIRDPDELYLAAAGLALQECRGRLLPRIWLRGRADQLIRIDSIIENSLDEAYAEIKAASELTEPPENTDSFDRAYLELVTEEQVS